MKYAITQSIWNDDDAEYGESSNQDYWEEDSLSSAIDSLNSTRTSAVGGVESISAEYWGDRLIVMVCNSMEYETGCYENRALHIHGITESSARRVAKIAGASL
jgi:hypothetical protein